MLQCGFYETDITPHIGQIMPGGFGGHHSKSVRDQLYASAFAVKANDETSIILSLDALMIEKEEADKIREGVAKIIDMPVSHISVNAIHTHAGGPLVNLYNDVKDPEYCNFVVNRAIDAAHMAYRNMEEAKIGVGSCAVDGVAFTRRYLFKDGTVQNNPPRMSPEIEKPLEDVDKELLVVRVDRMDGTPMGMITNFALHPAYAQDLPGHGFSADFPGEIRKHVRNKYGADLHFMFLQGAAGNINLRNPFIPKEEQIDFCQAGQILADHAIELFSKIHTEEKDVVRCTHSHFVGHTCRPTVEQIETVDVSDYTRRELRKALDLPDEEIEIEVCSMCIGDILIHMLPGELFGYFSLYLKEHSQFKHTIVTQLCNNKIGYINTKEAREMGGYDATPSTYIRMDVNAGYQILDSAMTNMERLKNNY